MYITDSAVTQAAGFTANVGDHAQGDVEDSATAALRFDNGTLGTLTSGYYTDAGYNSHIKIWGSKGWIHLEPHGPESEDQYVLRIRCIAISCLDILSCRDREGEIFEVD